KYDIKLMVLGTDVGSTDSDTDDLAEDLLSIVMVFTARQNSLRAVANKKSRREVEDAQDLQIPQPSHHE
ncbi:18948_t:CDS:1, partial [Gigaspora rosea]